MAIFTVKLNLQENLSLKIMRHLYLTDRTPLTKKGNKSARPKNSSEYINFDNFLN